MAALLLVIALFALTADGCGSDDGSESAGPSPDDPGPVHVHGLGVNPKDGVLLIATHTGLYRLAPHEQRPRRVGESRQDTMGFTVVGPDHFLGSGHPDLREDLPPLLGLIESRDAGNTWDPVSLIGEADFHVLEASGRLVYGFDGSNGRLMVSANGGQRWSERSTPEELVSLAIDPTDPRRAVAAGETGLHSSAGEGRRWRSLGGQPGLLAWPARERLFLVRPDGRVLVSRNGGGRWTKAGEVGGQPAAFEAAGPAELYTALHDGTVKRSTDGGASWDVRSRP